MDGDVLCVICSLEESINLVINKLVNRIVSVVVCAVK